MLHIDPFKPTNFEKRKTSTHIEKKLAAYLCLFHSYLTFLEMSYCTGKKQLLEFYYIFPIVLFVNSTLTPNCASVKMTILFFSSN